jgi:hypothetical protein
VRAVLLVILLGLGIGALGLVVPDLYTAGVLILFLGGVGLAVAAGERVFRYISSNR